MFSHLTQSKENPILGGGAARRNKIKNAVILLITGKNRVLLVRNKNSMEWMLPGGKIDASDTSPFHAAKREFKEETSFTLPRLSNLSSFIYNGHTIVYRGTTKQRFPRFQLTTETDQVHYPELQDLFNGKFEKKHKLVDYVRKCFDQMMAIGFI